MFTDSMPGAIGDAIKYYSIQPFMFDCDYYSRLLYSSFSVLLPAMLFSERAARY